MLSWSDHSKVIPCPSSKFSYSSRFLSRSDHSKVILLSFLSRSNHFKVIVLSSFTIKSFQMFFVTIHGEYLRCHGQSTSGLFTFHPLRISQRYRVLYDCNVTLTVSQTLRCYCSINGNNHYNAECIHEIRVSFVDYHNKFTRFLKSNKIVLENTGTNKKQLQKHWPREARRNF